MAQCPQEESSEPRPRVSWVGSHRDLGSQMWSLGGDGGLRRRRGGLQGGEDGGREASGVWLLLLSGRKAGDLQGEMAGALPKSVYDSMRWLWTLRQNFISGPQHMTYWLQNLLSSGVTTQRSTQQSLNSRS